MSVRCIIAIFFALGLALPAQAAITLGVVPEKGNQLRSESGVRQQTTQLEQLLNEEVRFRVFRSEADLYEWMQRYRMVDLALISRSFYNSQPAGSLTLLRQPSATDLAVARPGLSPETLHRLRTAVAALTYGAPAPKPVTPKSLQETKKPTSTLASPGDGELQPGHEILATPGQSPRVTAQPTRPTRPAKPKLKKSADLPKTASSQPAVKKQAPAPSLNKPAAVAETTSPAAVAPTAPGAQPAPGEPTTIAPPKTAPAEPVTPVEASPAVPEAEPAPPSAVPWLGILIMISGFGYLYYRRRQMKRPIDWSAANGKPTGKFAPKAPPKPPSPPPRPRGTAGALPNRPMPINPVSLSPAQKPVGNAGAAPPSPEPASREVSSAIPLVKPSSNIASIEGLLTNEAPGISDDHFTADRSLLGAEKAQELDLEIPSLEMELPLPETAEEISAPALIAPAVTEPISGNQEAEPVLKTKKVRKSKSESPPLRGDIATVNIPRLLKAAADQPGPCILHIRGRHDEKRLHFRNGHLADAVSVNRANRTKTGFLMNKVGYLLIRQGRITEEQRDQALRLCQERPKLRIGEALVELGALSRESLLEALQTQVEGVIFSLFIFPDGRYEIIADDSDTPAANDLNIDLEGLLRKAETQEPEWARIRQAIPSLDAVLDFPEGGRDKLDSARMTEHQKLVLSLVDGQRPIRDICIAATMLDLEVYKFLFFMVNARILVRI